MKQLFEQLLSPMIREGQNLVQNNFPSIDKLDTGQQLPNNPILIDRARATIE